MFEHPQQIVRRSRKFMIVTEEEETILTRMGAGLTDVWPLPAIIVPRALHIVPDGPGHDIQEPPPSPMESEPPLFTDAPEEESTTVDGTHFILSRNTAVWDIGSSIREVFHGTIGDAEECARGWKMRFPLLNIGIASLMSEIRNVANPVETVKLQ